MAGHPDTGSNNNNAIAPPGGAYVTLHCPNSNGTVSSLLDASNPIVTSGYGGWTLITRPKKVSLTDWNGVDPFRLQIGLILDSYALNAFIPLDTTVDDACKAIEVMASADRNSNARPPRVKIIGPVPKANLTYVIETLTWGDAIRNRDTGLRERQALTIGLLELVEDTLLNSLSPAKTMRSAVQAAWNETVPKSYTVMLGDTMGTIAARFYGKQSAWKVIAKANNLRDPTKIRVGQVLKMPNPSVVKSAINPKNPPPLTQTSNPYGPDPGAAGRPPAR